MSETPSADHEVSKVEALRKLIIDCIGPASDEVREVVELESALRPGPENTDEDRSEAARVASDSRADAELLNELGRAVKKHVEARSSAQRDSRDSETE